MRSEQLQYLIELSHNPSITTASQKLFLTPSALSTALKNMEEELGVILLNRTHMGVSLTTAGKRLVKTSEQFFLDVENIIKDITTDAYSDFAAEICFLAVPGAMDNFLSRAICHFYQAYPNVVVTALPTAADDIFKLMVAAQQEFALAYLISYQDTFGLIFKPLFRCQLMLQVAPSNPLARYKNISFKTLLDHTLVIHTPNNNAINKIFFEKIFNEFGYPQKVIFESNAQLCEEMINFGLAVGFSLLTPFHDQRPDSNNVVVQIKDAPKLQFGYLLNKDSALSLSSKIFLEHLIIYLTENIDRSFLITP